MIHAGERELRENRLCSTKMTVLKIISLVSRLAIEPLAFSADTQVQRSRGSLLTAALPGDGTTSSAFPRGFQKKPACLELQCWSIRPGWMGL